MVELHRSYFQPWLPRANPRHTFNFCGICGDRWPIMFHVPDQVWKYYVPPAQRDHMLCLRCWTLLTLIIDKRRYQIKHGGPTPMWSGGMRLGHDYDPDNPNNDEFLETDPPIDQRQIDIEEEVALVTYQRMVDEQ